MRDPSRDLFGDFSWDFIKDSLRDALRILSMIFEGSFMGSYEGCLEGFFEGFFEGSFEGSFGLFLRFLQFPVVSHPTVLFLSSGSLRLRSTSVASAASAASPLKLVVELLHCHRLSVNRQLVRK